MVASRYSTSFSKVSGQDPAKLRSDAIVAVIVGRNEGTKIPWFLQYYRGLGVDHFMYVDNDSDDDSRDLLAVEDDVTLFRTSQGYLESGCGRHWSTFLAKKFAMGRWCLTLDMDEILVFPLSDLIGLRELTAWMDATGSEALLTLMIDMYPKTSLIYEPGQSFIDACPYFDGGPYWATYSNRFPNVSFYGGMRHRLFFNDRSDAGPTYRSGAPVLRKVPLVRWTKETRYFSSTHSLKPCILADVTGALLHFKLLKDFQDFASAEVARGSRNPGEYEDYLSLSREEFWNRLHCSETIKFQDASQLVREGLMSAPKEFLNDVFPTIRSKYSKRDANAVWQNYKQSRLEHTKKFQPQAGHIFANWAFERGDF